MERMGIILLLTITILLTPQHVIASEIHTQLTEIEYLANGDYIETIFVDYPTISPKSTQTMATNKTKTAMAVRRYKNSSGIEQWHVSIKATFTYNGKTVKCTTCSVSASSKSSEWIIHSKSASKSGSSATGTATAHQKVFGVVTKKITKSVTVSCKADGTIY